jgi:uncharacterized protein (DUF362 family)
MEKNEILVIYGNNPEEMAYRLAEAAGLADLIGGRENRIGLKPNLVVARPASEGATTHPEIVRGIAGYLQNNGFRHILIMEGAWVGARTRDAFSVCGYKQLARDMGLDLIDTQDDQARMYDCRGMNIAICDSAMGVDFMINLPVMKGHCQTLLTCALKNNKGIIPNREKRRFHSLGLHKPIAHLNTVVKNDFILVDGICGDMDFEEGGNPVPAGRMFAARDPVLCDAWAADRMGYAPGEIPYIGLAEKLGVGCGNPAEARVRELNRCADAVPMPQPGGTARRLAPYIREDRACSACYAALILALSRMSRNELDRLREPISIGQGFTGKTGSRGVGRCTIRFDAALDGCPPSASGILEFLRNQQR